MNLRPLGLALALAIFPCAGALAQSTIEAPAGSGQRFQGTIAINPATGQPASPQVGAPYASGTGGISPATIGTTPQQVLAAAGSPPRKSIFFYNQAQPGTATVTVCPASVSSPAPYAPGCITLQPGGGYLAYPASGYVPQDAWNAVASAANTPLTVEAH